jgi:arylsulfatase A-like enzyme
MSEIPRELPNILWICTDQQRYDTIHHLGNPHIHTPNIDRLCEQGVAFTRAYCQNPICTPSRASFLTGLYPSAVHANINGNARFRLPDNARLITRHLKERGYTCGLAGKLHLASAWNGVEERLDDGYDAIWYSHSGIHHFGGSNQYGDWLRSQGKFDDVLDRSEEADTVRRYIRYRENVPFELHQTTWCADRAIDFMNRHRGRPWLFSVNPFDPHPPYDAPDDFRRRYESGELPAPTFRNEDLEVHRRLSTHFFQTEARKPGPKEMRDKASYYGMIEIIDRNVGRMLQALERTGQRENTIVIFTSDHGEMLGDHGLQLKGCRFYEALVRVPLIISWPRGAVGGKRCDDLVELTDLAPTLADVSGESLPWTHGRSLLPLLLGATSAESHRSHVRCEYHDTLAPNWGTGREPVAPAHATMYRDERYKIATYHGNDYGELYDLAVDPCETRNLWEEKEVAELRYRLTKQSFDASMVIHDPGSIRVGRY